MVVLMVALVYEQGVQLEDNLDGVCNDVFF